jgi:transposase
MNAYLSHPSRRERAATAKSRVEAGEKPIALADEYGVSVSTVYRWIWGGQNSGQPRKVKPLVEVVEKVAEPVYRPANSVFAWGAQA